MADLSKLSNADLQALQSGNIGAVSTQGLMVLRGQPAQQEPAQSPNTWANMPARLLAGAGGGLIKAGVGGIQAGAQALGADEVAQAAGRVTQDINQNLERMGTAAQVGGFVGEVAPYVALPAAAPTLAGRIALGAAGGSAQGALQAQETPDMKQRGQSALKGAAIGAFAPVALAGVGKAITGTSKAVKSIKSGVMARGVDELDEAATALREQANNTYAAMRQANVVVKPERMAKVADDIETAVRSVGDLDPEVHKKTLSVVQGFKDKASKGALSLEQIDLSRQLMKEVAGGFDADAMRARKAIEALDDAVLGIGAKDIQSGAAEGVGLLKQARKEYAQRMKFETVSEIVQKAEGDPQKLQTAAKNFLANKKKTRGFTGEERRAIADLANRGGVSGVLRLAGTFGFDPKGLLRNQLSGVALGAGAATTIGALPAAGIAALGTGARQLEKFVSRGKAENLLQTIERGAYQNMASKAASLAGKSGAKPTMLQRVADALVGGAPDDVVRAAGSKQQAVKTVQAIARDADDATKAEAAALTNEIRRMDVKNSNPSTPSSSVKPKVNSQTGSASNSLVLPLGVAAGGLAAADFASSLATNTSYNPKEPIRDRNAERAMGMAQNMDAAESLDLSQIPTEQLQQMLAQVIAPLPQAVSQTFLINEEGFRPTAYKDSVGITTIGYGFNLEQPNAADIIKRVKIPERYELLRNGTQALSEESARKLFDYKHRKSEQAAAKIVPQFNNLGENQRAALTSMAYHMGGEGLRKFRQTLSYLKEGNAKAVENQLLSSEMARQTPARAQRTALMLAYNLSPEEAEARLVEQGRIGSNERKYITPSVAEPRRQRVRYNDAKAMVGLNDV